MQRRDPKPEIQRLEELALAVKAGDIKLPRFQRPFVWQRSDILKLFDSIYKGYPIGSILIWNSSQRLTSERSILGLSINELESINYPTNYLLDGQQRLTALCGALFWNGSKAEDSLWNVQFDLVRDEFIYAKDADPAKHFPLNRLIDTTGFIQQCMTYSDSRHVKKAERLLRAFKDYKIAVVKIGDMTIEEVAPIFERINSTGRKLTLVDLMMAATWSAGFDLNKTISAIAARAAEQGFELKEQVLLRSISAAADGGINKEDIQRLRKREPAALTEAARAAESSSLRAIDFLKRRLQIFDFPKIPYALQFTHLVEYFRVAGDAHSGQKEDELVKWFWFTATTRYFASANSGQNARDLAGMRDFAAQPFHQLYQRKRIDVSSLLFDRFNLRISTSITFSLLLSQPVPSLTLDNRPMDSAYLAVKSSKFYKSLMVGVDLNVGKILHPYPGDIEPVLRALVPDHLLSEESLMRAEEGDAQGFVAARAGLIADLLISLTGCQVVFQVPADLPADADDFSVLDDQDLEDEFDGLSNR